MIAAIDSDYMDALDAISFSSGLSLRPDAIRQRRWRAANRDRQRIRYVVSAHNRVAARNGGGRIELSEWLALLADFDFCCARCGDSPELLTMDHIIPKSKHGPHSVDNVQPLCWPCHKQKGLKAIRYEGRWVKNRKGIDIFESRYEEIAC